MKIIMGSHLTIAAKLSNDRGPPLTAEVYKARALPTPPQAQQQQQDGINKDLAA